jgi:hypothetical protein
LDKCTIIRFASDAFLLLNPTPERTQKLSGVFISWGFEMKKYPVLILLSLILIPSLLFFFYPFIFDWMETTMKKRAYLIEKPEREAYERVIKSQQDAEILEAYKRGFEIRKGERDKDGLRSWRTK